MSKKDKKSKKEKEKKNQYESDTPDCLKLENQLCFPLYACAKEVIRRYRPLLDPFDLTYTQYIVMMVLWEEKQINVKMLGEKLYLDSGTLTPLLKKLESKGYVKRERSLQDERNLNVTITEEGERLKLLLRDVPGSMQACVCLEPEDAIELHRLLKKVLKVMK